MKALRYIFFSLPTLILASCASDDLYNHDNRSEDNNTLSVSLFMPDMGSVLTRSLGENPDYADLHLYVVEFNDNGDPLNNDLSNIYLAEDETPLPAAAPNQIVFKLSPNQAENPKVLHLIAVPKNVQLSFGEFGFEGNIIPALTTSNGNDAYWRRVQLPNGYGEIIDGNWVILDEAREALTGVPMIRNFAKITVTKDNRQGYDATLDNFDLEGYALVNVPSAGTVAPWISTETETGFPDFVDPDDKTQIPYIYLNYSGILAGNIRQQNVSEASFTGPDATSPKYLYERPYSDVNHTQLIVKGNYNNEGSSYYKIDLGEQEDGQFNFFNLIRNFNYIVRITKVGSSGYSTPMEALNGVVYNNLSFDIDTQNMLNISNGSDMLWVNFTTAVISQNTDAARTLKFRFRYKTNIGSNGGTVANSGDYVKNLEPGTVIESVSGPVTDGEWMEYTIKTKAPSPDAAYQSFVVVNNATGLGRTINLILRDPWEVTDAFEAAGNYDYSPFDIPTDSIGTASAAAKQPLTIFFTIPNDLPKAIFPLSFVMESNMQNIENNPIGTLVVSSGSSSFENVIGRRIKYIKTVSWSDYNNPLSEDYPTGTIVNENGKDVHKVRSRFRTITALTDYDNVSQATSTVRITNQYFTTPFIEGSTENRVNDGKIDVTFTRKK